MSGLSLGVSAFVLFGVALFFWIRLLNDVALEGRRGILFGLCVAGIGIGVAAWNSEPGWLGGTFASLAILGGVIWIALGLLAGQSKQSPLVVVGEPLPAFSAPDPTGASFDIESLRGHPVLIKLFRGHW